MTSHFFLAVLKILVSGFHKFDYNVSLRVFHTWWTLSFLDVYIHVFHQIWGVFSHYFIKYSLCSFLSSLSGLHTCVCWSTYWCLIIPSAMSTFLQPFLSIHHIANFHSPISKITNSFFCQLNSASESSSEFFMSQFKLLYFCSIISFRLSLFINSSILFRHCFLWFLYGIHYFFEHL